jgi:hypothetical protein
LPIVLTTVFAAEADAGKRPSSHTIAIAAATSALPALIALPETSAAAGLLQPASLPMLRSPFGIPFEMRPAPWPPIAAPEIDGLKPRLLAASLTANDVNKTMKSCQGSL